MVDRVSFPPMPMMRVLFLVLLILNLLALAFWRGWLGTPTPEGEPERLTNQLNPERIALRPPESPAPEPEEPKAKMPEPAAESAAPPVAPIDPKARTVARNNGREDACIALSGLTETQADSLAQSVRATVSGVRTSHETSTTPSSWWVRIPPGGGREGAELRVAELRTLGIDDLFIVQEPGPNQYSISLGLFKSESKAQQHLTMLQNKRVRTASIVPRNVVVHRVEVRGPTLALDAVSTSRPVRLAGANVSECKP